MFLQNLVVSQFRNLTQLSLNFGQNLNIFKGDNGQGKSNLLEAICLLTQNRSFRPSSTSSFLQHTPSSQAPQALIVGQFMKGDLDYEIRQKISVRSKVLTLNGKRVTTSLLAQKFPLVLFSPESLSAIKAGPEERRVLIDDLLMTHCPQKAGLITEYKKCLKQRNRLLRDLRDQVSLGRQEEDLLESLNGVFFPLAVQLTKARTDALKDITPFMKRALTHLSKEHFVDISVEYVVSSQSALDWSESQIYEALIQRHQRLKLAEKDAGVSLVGPHKHDIQFQLNGHDSRYFCSQGQQRALILSFKMAQIMYHRRVHEESPFLLLDDVLSELDQEKRGNLIAFLEGIDSQIFVTTTDLSFSEGFRGRDLSIFEIEQGRVLKARQGYTSD